MGEYRFIMTILKEKMAICSLDKDQPFPSWAAEGRFFSLTRTPWELSLVCPQEIVPAGIRCQRDWRSLKVEGTLDFSLTGVLASLAGALALVGLSIFALSTYDTDYLLVQDHDLDLAVQALAREGHTIRKE